MKKVFKEIILRAMFSCLGRPIYVLHYGANAHLHVKHGLKFVFSGSYWNQLPDDENVF